MSKERELLKRAIEALHFDLSAKESAKVAEEIRTYLNLSEIPTGCEAQPEADLDCTRSHPHEDMNKQCELRTEIAKLRNALANTRPEPVRKPMTEEYIRILYGDDNNFELTAPYVIAFARAVERYHGIEKDDEFCDSHCTWLDHHSDCRQFIAKTEAKNPPLATAIGQAVKITENGDHIAYEIFDGDKWLRLEPVRKPMTEEEIAENDYFDGMNCMFYEGVRFAEKHHNIK